MSGNMDDNDAIDNDAIDGAQLLGLQISEMNRVMELFQRFKYLPPERALKALTQYYQGHVQTPYEGLIEPFIKE